MTLIENVSEVMSRVAIEDKNKLSNLARPTTIVGVTKYVDANQAKALVEAGITHIGENRVELFLDKYHQLHEMPITWHLIGTLQRRKVKEVINYVDYFHALDSVKLAKEINKRADHVINCFLQVNISGETSKHGFSIAELKQVLPELAKLENIAVVGIMTMTPREATEDEKNSIFAEAKAIQENISSQKILNMPCTELSMGMSQDYPQAIKHGATFVRIGSEFFK
ncbi:YggS family pyridoxal phosphate-dependent enzyme [Pseudolactococcus plantarum]|uniref:Pyridoxal phosphate homeostasis protein n=1 Tax=Pseudolactococcus plantarum TaxID=1365 RepID=A0A2A5RXE4_9LACT|nr:cell division protein [Lactococcus plantarum]HCN74350.1 YggS family pyridoxal phosphate-dependent enzyme [Lactococcus sp.]